MRKAACAALLACWALASGAAAEDRIFFSRDFPGSTPAYFEVTVAAGGQAVYREAPDDELPIEFEIDGETVSYLFGLAEQAGRFQRSFASKKRTAFTGEKVFRYESAEGETHETKFVFTEDETARELLAWFERVGETERHLIELERVTQFDRLGVNKVLLHLQSSYDKGRIVAPEQFLPILRKIVDEEKIIHLARARAAGLIEHIEGAARAARR